MTSERISSRFDDAKEAAKKAWQYKKEILLVSLTVGLGADQIAKNTSPAHAALDEFSNANHSAMVEDQQSQEISSEAEVVIANSGGTIYQTDERIDKEKANGGLSKRSEDEFVQEDDHIFLPLIRKDEEELEPECPASEVILELNGERIAAGEYELSEFGIGLGRFSPQVGDTLTVSISPEELDLIVTYISGLEITHYYNPDQREFEYVIGEEEDLENNIIGTNYVNWYSAVPSNVDDPQTCSANFSIWVQN